MTQEEESRYGNAKENELLNTNRGIHIKKFLTFFNFFNFFLHLKFWRVKKS